MTEWDCSRNIKSPKEYLPYSNKRVAWICEQGHRWEEKINNRTANGINCPYCNGSRPIPRVNDLGTLFPWLATQWNQAENGDIKPSDVFPNSNRMASWKCATGHEWKTKIYHRTEGTGCPYCTGAKPIPGETDLETLEPEIASQWHPTKNDNHQPSEFTRFSHFCAMWLCDEGHEYSTPIYRRSRGCGCSVCNGKSILPGINDLETRAPGLAKEWDHVKNEGITPDRIALHDNRKYNWICSTCGHSWKASPNNRANGRGCPKRAGRCVVPEINSFAAMNPHLSDQWDPIRNRPLTAWDVAAYDNRDYYWICENRHSFSASPANRTKGTGCPYCKGKLPVVGVNDFATLFPIAAAEWHPTKNEDRQPEHFLPTSHEEVWWRCRSGHEWKASIESRMRGSRCQECSNRRIKHSYLL